MEPRLRSLPILTPHGFSTLGYVEWGSAGAARTVVCVHGLTRNARDFDVLAQALAAEGMRVVAADMPGRGRSAWLAHAGDYGYPVYLGAVAALIARLDVAEVDWIGTSMGGLIGMMLAAQPGAPVARLVMNDIGPFLPKAALGRIGTYVGADPAFADEAALEAYLRRVHAPFGPLTDAEWRHLARHSSRGAADGTVRLHYDPRIAEAFVATEPADIALWPVWEAVACPTLVLRGAASDLLLEETAVEMTTRGRAAARTTVRTIADCGHAPALMAADQVALIRDWLAA